MGTTVRILLVLLALVFLTQPVYAIDDPVQLQILKQFQVFQPAKTITPDLVNKLLAKAKPDECFTSIGGPITYPPCGGGSVPKVNQAYVWGLTMANGKVWFGTGPNILCLVAGGWIGIPPMENASWVCEGNQNPVYHTDWRPPKIYMYNPATKVLTDKTPSLPLSDQPSGFRSAGSLGNVVFLAGPPAMGGGIKLFAYRADTGAFLGNTVLPRYDDIRRWLVVNGVLYCGVENRGPTYHPEKPYGGTVLRWRGSVSNPFQFEEVGYLGSSAADLALHEGRIFSHTWPNVNLPVPPENTSLYMSPKVPSGGLTSAHLNSWTRLWQVQNYEPDPLVASTYGGGALQSFGGYLYWGTMHVPFVAAVTAEAVFHLDFSDPVVFLNTAFGTHRSPSIFRGKNFGTSTQTMQVLYGEEYFPIWDANQKKYTFAMDAAHRNKMGKKPTQGHSGFGNFFNAYTWSMSVFNNRLYVGTFDWSYLLTQGVLGIIPDTVSDNSFGQFDDILKNKLPMPSFGGDLYRLDTNGKAELVSNDGVGNFTNYGVRNMLTDTSKGVLYLGMANAMNLLTNPNDDFPEGGWELIGLYPKKISLF